MLTLVMPWFRQQWLRTLPGETFITVPVLRHLVSKERESLLKCVSTVEAVHCVQIRAIQNSGWWNSFETDGNVVLYMSHFKA